MPATLKTPRPLATLIGARVRVYWNITKKVWSVQHHDGSGWRVAGHDQALALVDVRFEVSEAGRQTVLRTGRKNVHAYATGLLASAQRYAGRDNDVLARAQEAGRFRVSYNPRRGPGFALCGDWPGDPGDRTVRQAGIAYLDAHGLVFINRRDG